MTRKPTEQWWKCRRTGCAFDAHKAMKATDMSCATGGDFTAKIMQVHLLDHICDLLVEEKLRDYKIVDRALRVAERGAAVAEGLAVVRDAERIAAAAIPVPSADLADELAERGQR